MKKFIVSILVLACSCTIFAQEDASKKTLGITKITANKTLLQKMTKDGKIDTLNRILESLDSNLTSAIHNTRKFEIVTRSNLDAVSKEIAFAESGNVAQDANAAKSGMMKGAQLILVVSIDDFQDYKESAIFATLNKSAEKRILRISANAQIIDSTTGSIKETVNFTVSNMDISDQSFSIAQEGNLNDALIAELSRIMSEKIAVSVADIAFPIRVLAKTGGIVTLNRGEGSGIKLNDMFEIFTQGETLIDPDTGENLGCEEVYMGKLTIIRVMPKTSHGELHEDRGVEKNQIVRPVKIFQ